MKFVSGFLAAYLLAIVGGAALIYSGAYNVAADKDHTAMVKWILGTAMSNSVKAHAGGTMPPAGFDAEDHVREGFRLFDEMCVQCHGAPGKQPGEVGSGASAAVARTFQSGSPVDTATALLDPEAGHHRHRDARIREHAHRGPALGSGGFCAAIG